MALTGIPGFVDLQVNGFLGVDFSSSTLTENLFARTCRGLLERGTAAFLTTVVTGPEEMYRQNLPLIAKVMHEPEFAGSLLGIHLEGPFLSTEPGAIGGHNPRWARQPDLQFLDRLVEWADGTVRLLTIAAEVEGAEDLARHAVSKGIRVSLGHQMAQESDLARLADSGATALTHLGNAVPNTVDRHRNPIWAGLAEDRLSAMIITDGHHLPPSLIKTFIRAKGVEKTMVISDMSHLAGLPPGKYKEKDGSTIVMEESGRLYDPKKRCLAGSSATMLECMNYLAAMGILSPQELLRVGFYNPLRLLGISPNELRATTELIYDENTRKFRT